MGDHVNHARNLSDEELRQELQDHGYACGPVTVTTRSVYEKKLVAYLKGDLLPAQNGGSKHDEPVSTGMLDNCLINQLIM